MSQDYIQKVTVRGSNPLCDDILMYDNFEGRLNWSGSGTGTDWVVAQSSGGNEMMDGQYGLKLQTKATTPAIGDEVIASRSMFLTPHKLLTFSGFFRFMSSTLVRRVILRLYCYTGAIGSEVLVAYSPINQRLEYMEYSGAWWPVIGGSINLHPDAWHRLSFVYDIINHYVVAVQCDSLVLLNLSAEPYFSIDTSAARVVPGVQLIADTAAQATSYLDHLYLFEQR